jgi:hypothetical protein
MNGFVTNGFTHWPHGNSEAMIMMMEDGCVLKILIILYYKYNR